MHPDWIGCPIGQLVQITIDAMDIPYGYWGVILTPRGEHHIEVIVDDYLYPRVPVRRLLQALLEMPYKHLSIRERIHKINDICRRLTWTQAGQSQPVAENPLTLFDEL